MTFSLILLFSQVSQLNYSNFTSETRATSNTFLNYSASSPLSLFYKERCAYVIIMFMDLFRPNNFLIDLQLER
jgi:hypothetical protein